MKKNKGSPYAGKLKGVLERNKSGVFVKTVLMLVCELILCPC